MLHIIKNGISLERKKLGTSLLRSSCAKGVRTLQHHRTYHLNSNWKANNNNKHIEIHSFQMKYSYSITRESILCIFKAYCVGKYGT